MPGYAISLSRSCLQPSHSEFRLLDALLDLLARMVPPAIGKDNKRKLFISSVFNAKGMRNAFPTARRQALEEILNNAKPDTWEDVGLVCTTLVLSSLQVSVARDDDQAIGARRPYSVRVLRELWA